ncbi:MAG: hypothetical protein ACRELG_07465, partial [Gemmataceae bacterium]
MRARFPILATLLLLFLSDGPVHAAKNLVADPSFEEPKERDQFGHVFAKWGGWIYEGECTFRVANVAHSGKHSLLMAGGSGAKIRAWPEKLTLLPGRYRITAYLRGLDVGTNGDGQSTEFMFDEKYLPLPLKGTFGWSRIVYVGDLGKRRDEGIFSFGLLASGYLWIDDVCVEQVGNDVAPTPLPLAGAEQQPIAPPGRVDGTAIHCPECGYRNLPAWEHCYACG